MDLYQFLEGVAANNNRPWLSEHRDEYDALRQQWLQQLQTLIDAMALWEPGIGRHSAKDSAYRFYRDTRFSADKSPFKTYFSAAMSPYGKKTRMAAYYLQLDSREQENGLYVGVWMPEAHDLSKLRHAIVDNIDEWEEVLAEGPMRQHWGKWVTTTMLKTAPKGWPKDHPQIEYLRLRDIGKFCPCTRDFFRDPQWPLAAAEIFAGAKPFVDFINYSLTEEI